MCPFSACCCISVGFPLFCCYRGIVKLGLPLPKSNFRKPKERLSLILHLSLACARMCEHFELLGLRATFMFSASLNFEFLSPILQVASFASLLFASAMSVAAEISSTARTTVKAS